MLRTKKVAAILLVIGILAATVIIQQNTIRKISRERDIYQQNTEAMMLGMEVLRRDSASQAYQIRSLTLTQREYESRRSEDAREIRALKVQLKRVTQISKQKLEIKAPVIAPVIHRSPDIKTVRLENRYISFVGTIRRDTLDAHVTIPVELKQYVYKVPKHKFLWWSWGCKGLNQIIHTNNPYVNLKYSEFIEIR